MLFRSAAAFALLAVSAGPGLASARSIGVLVNGSTVQFRSGRPQVIEGRVMVPLRGVLEQLGATVKWHGDDRSMIATRGDRDMYLPVGSRLAQVEGRPISLEAPPLLQQGTIYVSLQSLSESLGAVVEWDYRTQTVSISTLGRFA